MCGGGGGGGRVEEMRAGSNFTVHSGIIILGVVSS